MRWLILLKKKKRGLPKRPTSRVGLRSLKVGWWLESQNEYYDEDRSSQDDLEDDY
jgi:hypothetical protein